MAINVHIENLNIDTVTVSDELPRGSSPETIETSPTLFDDYRAAREAEEAENAELEARAEGVEPIPDHVMPFTRRDQLAHVIKMAPRLRKIRSGVTTSQETGIKDITSAKQANERLNRIFSDSLAKACGMCAFKGNCRLEENPQAWLRRHPRKALLVNHREQESLEDFQARLDENPMAHCMTPGQPREPRREEDAA